MEIRDATPADAESVAAVARASWHAAYDDLLGVETVEETVDSWYDAESLREQIREVTGASGACFLVADSETRSTSDGRTKSDDSEVVGFANAGSARDWESDPDGPDAFFSRLYVAPECWGEGIGTELTAHIARRLHDAGHGQVWLEVFAANERGRSFYESLGFERLGSVTEEFGGTEVTTLHLATALSELIDATPSPE